MTRPRPTSPGATARPAAFTMIEVIVVSVLMVVLAAIIVPRVVGGASRQARVTVDAVRDLVTAAGQREALTSQAVALAFDAEAPGGGRLSVLSAPASGKPPGPDPLLQPVALGELELERCDANGQTLSKRRWQVPLREGAIRPSLSLILRQADGARWIVSLPSEAASATATRVEGEAPLATTSASIDLDRAGKRGEAW
jgi:prepilin-type N-terminal cleavage/methylation domain-containing protein